MSIRKILAVLIGVLVLLNTNVTSFAINKEETKIIFNGNDYSDLSADETGKEKMLQAGHSLEFINSLSETTIKKVATADKALQVTSYYIEKIDENNKTYLKEITKDEFIKLGRRDTQKVADEYIKSAKVVNQYGAVLNKPDIKISSQNKSGVLMVKTTLFSIEWFIEGGYFVASEYLWTIPPKYRGTDYFGIIRGNNTISSPKSFESFYTYNEDVYKYAATSSGVIETKLKPNEYKQIHIPEKNKTTTDYIIETKLPVDCLPPNTIMFGAKGVARYYSDIRGGVCYQGAMQSPSVMPQNVNHYNYYIHQANTNNKDISLSVDKNRSIVVTPKDVFTDVVDTILYVWN